ncbi:MAG: hypothetical protein M1281_07950 [Chloroflexi bacterium]|nr:hypothetical protein [Chloroflexota bacterium]
MEQVGKIERGEFIVKIVGEDYSNCTSLFEGVRLTYESMASGEFPIFSDNLLRRFADGDLTEWERDEIEPLKTPFLPAKDEQIYAAMENVIFCEDKYRRGETGGQKKILREMRGRWGQVDYLEATNTMRMLDTRDVGQLVLTSRRFHFKGENVTIDQPLSVVRLILPYRDGFGIERMNKLKREYFKGNYHWPVIAAIFAGLVKRASSQERV